MDKMTELYKDAWKKAVSLSVLYSNSDYETYVIYNKIIHSDDFLNTKKKIIEDDMSDVCKEEIKPSIDYKFNEDIIVQELKDYIDGTYSGHYSANGKIQTNEYIMAQFTDGSDFLRGCALKYLARYGIKDGKNKKDLMKALHYIMLLINHNHMEKKMTQIKNLHNMSLEYQPGNIPPFKSELKFYILVIDGQNPWISHKYATYQQALDALKNINTPYYGAVNYTIAEIKLKPITRIQSSIFREITDWKPEGE